ncbi:MAG: tRNA1(Val) (adenine(37)-N6)-methyltransferase [Thermodesulfobacteriota bacterium]
MENYTQDTLFNGRLTLRQAASGYRFSVDAVILANLAACSPGQRVLDVGTGCGIIPMILAYRNPGIGRIYGIDIQTEFAATAAENVRQNGMAEQIAIRCADARTLSPADTDGPVDMLICNPPHYKASAGRINPDTRRAISRHEIKMTLAELVAAAKRMLDSGGRFLTLYPAQRLVDITAAMRNAGIEPTHFRFIHFTPGTEAKRVFVEGIAGKSPGATRIGPPLYLCDEAGADSPEIAAMYKD